MVVMVRLVEGWIGVPLGLDSGRSREGMQGVFRVRVHVGGESGRLAERGCLGFASEGDDQACEANGENELQPSQWQAAMYDDRTQSGRAAHHDQVRTVYGPAQGGSVRSGTGKEMTSGATYGCARDIDRNLGYLLSLCAGSVRGSVKEARA